MEVVSDQDQVKDKLFSNIEFCCRYFDWEHDNETLDEFGITGENKKWSLDVPLETIYLFGFFKVIILCFK